MIAAISFLNISLCQSMRERAPEQLCDNKKLGGRISPECAEAVNTADFGSFRDPKFPSYPDSAVMTK